MTPTPRRAAALVTTSGLLLVSACTSADGGGGGGASGASTTPLAGPEQQLTVLSQGPVLSWDPQRITSRQQSAFAGRTYLRTLTTYASATDLAGQKELVGDLATSTGRASKDQTRWSFTLRKGVSWQDGSRITCGDLRYGVSRSFSKDTASAGYALTYLDIPKKPDGSSRYPGPFGSAGRSAGATNLIQAAVTCSGDTITYRLSEPVADFGEVVSTPEFAPVKRSTDKGEDSAYLAYSNGPYKLEDAWQPGEGGTWVRNEEWDEQSDPVREPTLERIVHREGVEPVEAVEAITDGDDGSRSVLLDPLPDGLQQPVADAADQVQSVTSDGQIVDYLAPNHTSEVMRSARVRTALALATDREGYARALGGQAVATPVWSLLSTALPSAHEPVLDRGPTGDPEAARALLTRAKQESPRIRVAYRSGEQSDAAMAALKSGWEKAGFVVELEGLGEDYYTTIAQPASAKKYDVFWSSWGADYPSAATVLPPLFDDRINITSASSGRDYGYVRDDAVNAAMDKAMAVADADRRAAAWTKVDTTLLEQGSYVPLVQHRSTFVAGQEVTGLSSNAVFGGTPEMGTIGVAR
ncbi:ABC transporter substrate-binding protein [Janibacter melonis]|uniref:ABC transporter substrate-binding protein n=1 Tax=Janibacter melonis TaxID=262209 RepID=UPI0019187AF2|nr:ABC transporter substrate-binding protein [Janibacter melonis]